MSKKQIFFFVGIGTSTIGCLLQFVLPLIYSPAAPIVPLGLFGISLSAMWPALYLYMDESRDHFRKVEAVLAVAFSPDDSVGILRRVMQTAFFGGSTIDNDFWLAYCKRIYTDNTEAARKRIDTVLRAREAKTIEVEKEDVYRLMKTLFDSILKNERGGKYLAIATEADLVAASKFDDEGETAKHFIFDVPIWHPGKVQRLFIIEKIDSLANLSDDLKSRLITKINQDAHLPEDERCFRVLFRQNNRVNFGVYGHLAVGELNIQTGKNIVNFEENRVKDATEKFNDLFRQAQPLALDHLRP